MEDLIRLMVERWYLPEEQVRQFFKASFGVDSKDMSLEQIREAAAGLLQDVVLDSVEEK